MYYIGLFVCFLTLLSCKTRYDSQPCMENPGHGKLLVFVGKKITVNNIPSEGMDAKFIAKYEVLERVCGEYRKDTIEFTVFDHYGIPGFSKTENALLFVVEYEGKFFHEKYQYFDVYKTKDGRWASPNAWRESSADSLAPHKIDLEKQISFDLVGLKKQDIVRNFPQPFYRISNGRAIVEYGNYVEQLFHLKKSGVLKARGLFGDNSDMEVIPTEMAELRKADVIELSNSEQKKFLNTFDEFLKSISEQNVERIKKMSYDSVECSVCEGFSTEFFYNDWEPIDSFIFAAYRYFPGIDEWKKNSSRMNITAEKNMEGLPQLSKLHLSTPLIIYEVNFNYKDTLLGSDKMRRLQFHTLRFIKATNGFKFYSIRRQ